MIRLATMTSVCPDWTLDEIIEGMTRHGYQGLEPRVGWGHAAGIELDMAPAARAEARERCSAASVEICCIATGARFAATEEPALAASIAETEAAIDLAADLGAGYVRTFGGPRGAGELAGIVRRTATAYRQVLDRAAERGVVVLMETHDEWCVSTQVRSVVEQVDHPNLKVLWDLMHPARMGERPAETMSTIGALSRHVHVHDGQYTDEDRKLNVVALGDGVIDHETPLQLLKAAGFDGYASVEVIHAPGSEHDADGVLAQYADGLKAIIEAS
jgi:sugar phosphate isomerase/epimerase